MKSFPFPSPTPTSVLLILLVFLIHPSTQLTASRAPNHDLVTTTCKKTPMYQLCVSTLRSDPRSKTSDLAHLGLIVVDALKAKTTDALRQIRNNLKGSKPQLRGPLSECAETYHDVLEYDMPQTVEALTKGNPKFAESGLVDAASEAESCEKKFRNFKSPLTDVNRAVHGLSVVALAITRMLL